MCAYDLISDSGAQIFAATKNRLNILGAAKVTWNKVQPEDPQILGVSLQNLGARDNTLVVPDAVSN